MAQFMSDAWFDEVSKIIDEAGDLNLPAAIADLVLNVCVTGTAEGDKEMCLKNGTPNKGFDDSAPTKITVPNEIAQKLFIDMDQSAGMQAFMSGQLKVEGDMSKMMAMQSAQPSAEQNALMEKIKKITD